MSVCVCVREREKKKERKREGEIIIKLILRQGQSQARRRVVMRAMHDFFWKLRLAKQQILHRNRKLMDWQSRRQRPSWVNRVRFIPFLPDFLSFAMLRLVQSC